ncbi:MAG TPA: type II toxin-antitoxin system HipA family toxin [Burkholderiaceae bacterium]|jgi:serine/threonine-protein kinase HipA
MKELQVTYDGLGGPFLLGTLAEDKQDLLFQYSPQAIERNWELSPVRLPLRTAAYPDRRSEYVKLHDVPGLIYDSLPDSWGFRLMHRRMKARGIEPERATTLDRLAYLGSNTMGALTYAPAMSDAPDTRDLTLLELANEAQAVMTDDGHQVLAELARAGGSPGGARPKATVFFNPTSGLMSTRKGPVQEAQAWLVKFPGTDDEADSCALEELYARMARHCQLGMEETRFFELQGGRSAFGTKRFDRRGDARVHMHSLAGLLHADFQEPSVSYEDFFRVTRRMTRDQRQLKKAVQRCAFNVLMNNRDDHAKNLAFMWEADGSWHLAPPYDLTYCAGYQGEHFMDVAGEGRAPTRQHILQAAQAAGLPRPVAEEAIDEVAQPASTRKLRALAKNLPIRAATLDKVAEALKAHRKRLL